MSTGGVSAGRPRLLVICPPFFGYDRAIAAAAEAAGYAVTLMDARASTSAAYKIGLKLAPGLTRAATARTMAARLADLPDPAGIDTVLLVKGDGMTVEAVRQLRQIAPRARVVAYLWDSLDNMRGMGPALALADRVFSFDRGDCAGFGWSYQPLFARRTASAGASASQPKPLWDWSFIGSLHSDRHRVLRALVADNPGLRWFVHCYVQNRIVRLFRAISDRGVLGAGPPPLSMQVLDYARYAEVTAQSRAVVDIEHPAQTGLTMRTIETLIGGKKLITTNAAVRDSDLFHPDRVAVIDRAAPRIPAGFLASAFPAFAPGQAEGYLIDAWLAKLLGPHPGTSEALAAKPAKPQE